MGGMEYLEKAANMFRKQHRQNKKNLRFGIPRKGAKIYRTDIYGLPIMDVSHIPMPKCKPPKQDYGKEEIFHK